MARPVPGHRPAARSGRYRARHAAPRRQGLAILALAGLVASGTVYGSTAPEPASAAESWAQVECTDAARLFQLRAHGTELWAATVESPNAAPHVTGWVKVHDLADRPALAVAAHASLDGLVHLYVTDDRGGLRELGYDITEERVTSARLLHAGGTPEKPGPYRFTSLTSDGKNLFGVRDGVLSVMGDMENWERPQSLDEVGPLGQPRAFFGLNTGQHELGWTDAAGALHLVDVTEKPDGTWTLTTDDARSRGWGDHAIASAGGDSLLRMPDSTGLVWRHLITQAPGDGQPATITRSETLAAGATTAAAPITAVPNTCVLPGEATPTLGAPLPPLPAGALAEFGAGGKISREAVLARARTWLADGGVAYSMTGSHPGPNGAPYRTDCSGFVSMAWGFTSSDGVNTETLPRFSRQISKAELRPGDVLLRGGPGTAGTYGHVVIFAGWADAARTRYIGIEQGSPTHEHVIPYPYFASDENRHMYRPYRYTNIVDAPVTGAGKGTAATTTPPATPGRTSTPAPHPSASAVPGRAASSSARPTVPATTPAPVVPATTPAPAAPAATAPASGAGPRPAASPTAATGRSVAPAVPLGTPTAAQPTR